MEIYERHPVVSEANKKGQLNQARRGTQQGEKTALSQVWAGFGRRRINTAVDGAAVSFHFEPCWTPNKTDDWMVSRLADRICMTWHGVDVVTDVDCDGDPGGG